MKNGTFGRVKKSEPDPVTQEPWFLAAFWERVDCRGAVAFGIPLDQNLSGQTK